MKCIVRGEPWEYCIHDIRCHDMNCIDFGEHKVTLRQYDGKVTWNDIVRSVSIIYGVDFPMWTISELIAKNGILILDTAKVIRDQLKAENKYFDTGDAEDENNTCI